MPSESLRKPTSEEPCLVRQLNSEGRTFLIVEHNMDLVMNLCDHIIVFDRGRPIAEGSPSTIRSDPRVLEAYLGA